MYILCIFYYTKMKTTNDYWNKVNMKTCTMDIYNVKYVANIISNDFTITFYD